MSAELIRDARKVGPPNGLLCALADALERAEKERDEAQAETARRHPPRHPQEGWDRRWIRAKTQAAIVHLRDLEDWAILYFGGRNERETDEAYAVRLEGAPAMILARRSRECYEHISADIKNGRTTEPSQVERAQAERDRLRAENERLEDRVTQLEERLRHEAAENEVAP